MRPMSRQALSLVKGLAWSFIGAGALMAVGGFGGLLMVGPMRRHPDQSLLYILLQDFPDSHAVWDTIMAWIVPASWIQIVLAAFMIWAGIEFLRLKRWARAALEWTTWLTLLGVAAYGIFMVFFWLRMLRALSPEGDLPPGAGFLGVIAGGVVTALLAAPLVLTALLLRRKEVREACSR